MTGLGDRLGDLGRDASGAPRDQDNRLPIEVDRLLIGRIDGCFLERQNTAPVSSQADLWPVVVGEDFGDDHRLQRLGIGGRIKVDIPCAHVGPFVVERLDQSQRYRLGQRQRPRGADAECAAKCGEIEESPSAISTRVQQFAFKLFGDVQEGLHQPLRAAVLVGLAPRKWLVESQQIYDAADAEARSREQLVQLGHRFG